MNRMLLRRLTSLLYPIRCPVCGEFVHPEEGFCGKCTEKLVRYDGDHAISGAEGFLAPFEYTPAVKPAIMLMKDGIGGNAPYAFGGALAELILSKRISERIDMIVPTPMYRSDVRKRGFNQAELIARELGIRLNIAVRSDIVIKVRETLPQKTLDREHRQVNLRGAFSLTSAEDVRGRKILLLDDVCTTGSTLAELTGLLKDNGVAEVWCAACCKTPDRKELTDNDI